MSYETQTHRPPIVWIVQNDVRKDFTPAETYGTLAEIFYGVSDVTEPEKLVDHTRRVLQNWEPGDYLLMVGDPSLCALCLAVALESDPTGCVTLLRWDRIRKSYHPLVLDFKTNPLAP